MGKTNFHLPFRPTLQPSSVGIIRWKVGILGGVLVSILLFCWFYIGAQVIEMIASRTRQVHFPPLTPERIGTLTIISLALGSSITSWTWIGKTRAPYFRGRLFRRYARTLIALAFWFMVCAFTRFTTIHYLVMYWTIYDDHIPTLETLYPGLALLVSIVLISVNWMALRLVFQLPIRSKRTKI